MKKKGIVVATHPEDHSVDLVLSDGRRLTGVQVATPNGSTRSGTFDMPAVPEKSDKWDITQLTGQDQIALVDFVDGIPVVTGFLFPQISQMTFDDPKMRVTRHQSDVMSSIDGDGNIQITHPSGTYIRIGETPDKVDMAAKNTDASLAVDRNTGRKVNIRIGLAGGVLELTMTPEGAVSLKCAQGVTIEAGEAVVVKAPSVTLDTPSTTLTGNLQVEGNTTVDGTTTSKGALVGQGGAQVSGGMTNNGKDVGSSHSHSGVRGGGDTSGPPV